MPHRIAAVEALPRIRPDAERALSLALAPDEPVLWRAEPRRVAMLMPFLGILPFLLACGVFALVPFPIARLIGGGFTGFALLMAGVESRAMAHTSYAITERQVLEVHGDWRRVPKVTVIGFPTLVKVSCVARWFSTADLELYVTMNRDPDGIVAPDLVLRGLHRRDVARFIEHLPQVHRPELPR